MEKMKKLFLGLIIPLFVGVLLVGSSNQIFADENEGNTRFADVEITLDYNGGVNPQGDETFSFTHGNYICLAGPKYWFTTDYGGVVTRDGFEFTGWAVNGVMITYDDPACLDKFGNPGGYDMAKDGDVPITFVAQWDRIINLDYNGGIDVNNNVASKIKLAQDQSYNLADLGVTRTGYELSGWTVTDGSGNSTLAADGTYVADFTKTSQGAVTIEAQWKRQVNIDFNGGVDSQNQTSLNDSYDDGTVIDLNSLGVSKEGYTLTGWQINDNGNITDVAADASYTVNFNNDAIVYISAQWNVNQYDITIDYNGGKDANGNVQKILTLDYGSKLTLNELNALINDLGITKKGNTFSRWTDINGQLLTFPYTVSTNNLTIVAQWYVNKYEVTLDFNSGKSSDGSVIKTFYFDYNSELTQAFIDALGVTNPGYELMGWRPYPGDFIDFPYPIPDENITLYATWAAIPSYNLTYDLGEGSFVDTSKPLSSSLLVGTDMLLPTADDVTPPTDKYLSGWKIDANDTVYAPNSLFIMPNYNVTFTAQYSDNPVAEVTITFDLAGGSFSNSSLLESLTIPVGDSITLASASDVTPPEGKLALTGWLLESASLSGMTLAPGSAYTANEDATFTAQYSDAPVVEEFNLTYDLGEGSFVDTSKPLSSSIEAGTEMLLPTADDVTAPTGKYLSGWKLDLDETIYAPNSLFIMPSSDATLTAQYSDNPVTEVTITFDLAGGSFSNSSLLESLTIPVGDSITLASASDVTPPEGKSVLKGWLLGSSSVILSPGSTYTANENVTFTAVYDDITEFLTAKITIQLGDDAKFAEGYTFNDTAYVGDTIFLPNKEDVVNLKGKKLKGWKIKAIESNNSLGNLKANNPQVGDVLEPGASYYVVNADVTFIPVWKSSNSSGGSSSSTKPTEPGTPTEPGIPTEPGTPTNPLEPLNPDGSTDTDEGYSSSSKFPSTGTNTIITSIILLVGAGGLAIVKRFTA